jgi:hypothetical protein
MLDCILSGLALLFVFRLLDLSNSISLLFFDSLVLRRSETGETDFLLSFDKLLLNDGLDCRIVLATVTDLFGTSIFPAATKVCEGITSGFSSVLK